MPEMMNMPIICWLANKKSGIFLKNAFLHAVLLQFTLNLNIFHVCIQHVY